MSMREVLGALYDSTKTMLRVAISVVALTACGAVMAELAGHCQAPERRADTPLPGAKQREAVPGAPVWRPEKREAASGATPAPAS